MKKKLSLMLVVILILQILLPTLTILWESGITLKSNAEDNAEYYINTAQDLWDFAAKVNNRENIFNDVTVYLTADIDLGCNENNQWVPISGFWGVFNGQNHTISGIYIKSEETDLGLFGEIQGSIENLTISNSYIESTNEYTTSNINMGFIVGDNFGGNNSNPYIRNCTVINSEMKAEYNNRIYAGGICGYSSGVTIEYCKNYANIYTKYISATGGIVGENYGIVRKSSNNGTVIGDILTSYNSCGVGGIAGSNHGDVNLCCNYGDIKAPSEVGGIVGSNTVGHNVISCYNVGTIEGTNCGGIVGDSDGSRIINCYNAGEIIASSNGGTICYVNRTGGLIQNCYYLETDLEGVVNDNSEENTEIIEKNKTEMQSEEFTELLNIKGKQFEYISNSYPSIDLEIPNVEVGYSQTENNSITVEIISNEYIREIKGWTYSDDRKTLTKTFYINQNLELIVEDYNYNQTTVAIEIDTLTDSIITEEDYYINNLKELQIFAQEVNNGNNCEGKNIYLMNNIEIDKNYIWDVIGQSKETAFMGNFYGNSKKINGININEYSYYKGFFGYIENASIKGLEVSGTINGESRYTGGIVAEARNSYIEKCINNISINEEYNLYDNNFDDIWAARVGGILGYGWNETKDAAIFSCVNNGRIIYNSKGTAGSCGGCAGDVQGYKILYSSNNADIITTDAMYTGGIAGKIWWAYIGVYIPSQIEGSYNRGNVTVNYTLGGTGGIVGETNLGYLINNYNSGNINYTGWTSSKYKIGGIVGATFNKIILLNCYNVGEVENGGIVGLISSTSGTVTNNYYLKDSTSRGYYSSEIEEVNIEEKDENEMKNESFATLLNGDTIDGCKTLWKYDSQNINNGYPIIELEVTMTSEKYDIEENTITKILPKTGIQDFKANLQTNGGLIEIYNKDNQLIEKNQIVTTGMKIKYTLNSKQQEYTLAILGDIDEDGEATFTDILQINKHRLGKALLTGIYLEAAEVTGDGNVDFMDILQINKYRLGKIESL